jgi:hypothetical protein
MTVLRALLPEVQALLVVRRNIATMRAACATPIYPVNDQVISLELESKGAVACSLESKIGSGCASAGFGRLRLA